MLELVTVRNTCSGRRLPAPNPAALLSYYTPLCFFRPPFCNPTAPTQPPPRAQLCRTRELNVFKGVRRGPSNPQRRLGSGSPPSRFIASVLPKSYFTVPSIRSLGSPQLPSPDAGLSPSLGTRTGHGEREACDTHQQAQHQHRQRTSSEGDNNSNDQTHLL